jgi:hypothetical protein
MSDKSKTDLLLFAFASAEAEYKDLSETWKLLDTKSQATTAIARQAVLAQATTARRIGRSLQAVQKRPHGSGPPRSQQERNLRPRRRRGEI